MFISHNDITDFETTPACFGRDGSVEVQFAEGDTEFTSVPLTMAHFLLSKEPHNEALKDAIRQAELVEHFA